MSYGLFVKDTLLKTKVSKVMPKTIFVPKEPFSEQCLKEPFFISVTDILRTAQELFSATLLNRGPELRTSAVEEPSWFPKGTFLKRHFIDLNNLFFPL